MMNAKDRESVPIATVTVMPAHGGPTCPSGTLRFLDREAAPLLSFDSTPKDLDSPANLHS